MHPDDKARYELWEALSRCIDADIRLQAMTDAQLADLLLKVYSEKESFSLEDTLLSNVMDRLKRANGGPWINSDEQGLTN